MRYLLIPIILFALTGCGQADLGQMIIEPAKKIDKTELEQKKLANPIIDEKYKLEKAAFIKEAKDENSIKVEVGDKTKDEFEPKMKISRWEDEVSFTIGVPDKTKLMAEPKLGATDSADLVLDNEKIEYVESDIEYHYYDIEPNEEHPEGAFEYEIVLNEIPKTNIIEIPIETEGLNFFYQPALTQEEIDEGAERPENVVGSYAVYHATKSNYKIGDKNYKSGKAFHIYRPKIIDNNGDWIWGELHIDAENKLLTVTVDDKWLEKAVYPVVVDPTFGYTSNGSSSSDSTIVINFVGSIRSDMVGGKATLSEAGTLSKVSIYLDNTDSVARTCDIIVCVYTEDGNGADSHSLEESSERTGVSISTAATWYDFTFSSSLSADDFILSAVADASVFNSFKGVVMRYDTGSTGDRWYRTSSNGYSASDPWNREEVTTSNKLYSIYATYTAGGEPPADSCTYSGSGDWTVQYSDNCYVTSDTYIAGDLNCIYDGAGSFNLQANLMVDGINAEAGCEISAENSAANIEIY